MNDKLLEEDISVAYLGAIAAAGGLLSEVVRRDEDGKDIMLKKDIHRSDGNQVKATLAFQLKASCSRNKCVIKENEIIYDLDIKGYNDLITKSVPPIALALLVLPEDEKEWVHQTVEQLVIKKCMYWISLYGREKSNNKSTVSIHIPKRNILTPGVLNQLMQKVGEGEEL